MKALTYFHMIHTLHLADTECTPAKLCQQTQQRDRTTPPDCCPVKLLKCSPRRSILDFRPYHLKQHIWNWRVGLLTFIAHTHFITLHIFYFTLRLQTIHTRSGTRHGKWLHWKCFQITLMVICVHEYKVELNNELKRPK